VFVLFRGRVTKVIFDYVIPIPLEAAIIGEES